MHMRLRPHIAYHSCHVYASCMHGVRAAMVACNSECKQQTLGNRNCAVSVRYLHQAYCSRNVPASPQFTNDAQPSTFLQSKQLLVRYLHCYVLQHTDNSRVHMEHYLHCCVLQHTGVSRVHMEQYLYCCVLQHTGITWCNTWLCAR